MIKGISTIKAILPYLVVFMLSVPLIVLIFEYSSQTVPYGRGLNVRYGYFSRVSPEILAISENFLTEYAKLHVGKPREVGRTKRLGGTYALNYHFEYGVKSLDISTTVCTKPLLVIHFFSKKALMKGQLENHNKFYPDPRPSLEEVFEAAQNILEYLGVPKEKDLYRITIRNNENISKMCSEDDMDCVWLVESLTGVPEGVMPPRLPYLQIVFSFYSLNLIYFVCDEDYINKYHTVAEETP